MAAVANDTGPVSAVRVREAGACSVRIARAVARARVGFATVTLSVTYDTSPPTNAGAVSSSGCTFAASSTIETNVLDSSWADVFAARSVVTLVTNLARFRL